MRSRLKLLRNLVIASGIIVALGFGANQASACQECDPPPDHSCAGWPDKNLYCKNWCINIQHCYDGLCNPWDVCVCAEK